MSTVFIQGLGLDYFHLQYINSYFTMDGDVYRIRDTDGARHVTCHKWEGTTGHLTIERVPIDVFTGFSMFRIPRLGYRMDNRGNLVWMDSIRTTQRGMRMDKLAFSVVPSIRDMIRDAYANLHQDPLRVYFPKFDKFSDGLKNVMQGKVTGFALDHDSAVVVDAHKENAPMSILYRQRQVGEISDEGEITYNGAVVKRSMLPKLLSKEE